MNVLYKYCDQLGAVKILETLELKLPYISMVNDPLECLPFFYCPNDKEAIRKRCLAAFANRKIPKPTDFEKKLDELYESGFLRARLLEGQKKTHREWNDRKGCLLSVTKSADEAVMWAHYAEIHKGAVVGIDFDCIFGKKGVVLDQVNYSKDRPAINILEEPLNDVPRETSLKTLITKSISWRYENEFRTIFLVDHLEELQKEGLAAIKNFKGKETWFLRLNPESIREVVFGLFAEDSLKQAIENLVKRPELQHVKLYQAKESETYTLDLIELESK